MANQWVSIRISERWRDRVEVAANLQGLSRSELIRRAASEVAEKTLERARENGPSDAAPGSR